MSCFLSLERWMLDHLFDLSRFMNMSLFQLEKLALAECIVNHNLHFTSTIPTFCQEFQVQGPACVGSDRDWAAACNTRCGRKVMWLAMLCTNWQCCCLPLHMAVRLTSAVDSVQVWTCYSCYAIVESVWSEVVFVRCITKMDQQEFEQLVLSNFV